MTTFGEVSYNDDFGGNDNRKSNNNNKDLWMKLDSGSNEIRLVTAPYQYLVHKVKKDPANPKDFGQKVKCSMIHGSCPVCAAGNKAKQRWYYGIIDRKTGTYKILDVSSAVFHSIRKLAKNAKFGDPTKYDLNIEVDKNGGALGYYQVQALPKEPLSATDQKLKDDADLDQLKKLCTPLTVEGIQKVLDKVFGVTGAVVPAEPAVAAKKSVGQAKAPAVNMKDDDDLSDSFPAYNEDNS